MFENRSFDHLFGAFPGADGVLAEDGTLKPDIYNLPDPTSPPSQNNPKQLPIEITPDVPLLHDFNHNFGSGMLTSLFGPNATGVTQGAPTPAPGMLWPEVNSGFYSTKAFNVASDGSVINGALALSYYRHGSLQVLHKMAADFVLCDNWFCDIPGDTLLNRYFMHAAQTGGFIGDDQGGSLNAPTIFDRLDAAGLSWKMYAPDAARDGTIVRNQQTDTRFLNSTIQMSPNTRIPITQFAADAQAGNLPFYSFLMCWLPAGTYQHDTSMHPTADPRAGENLLASVYAALRNSPSWEETLLVVTFDESGGIYDHVAPPQAVPPDNEVGWNWDAYRKLEVNFDFSVLGPRIPALLISPWLRPGIAKGQYQNTSILKFIEDCARLDPLTHRDGQAPSLATILDQFGQAEPRADCPTSYPTYLDMPYANGDLGKTYVAEGGQAFPLPSYMESLAELYHIDAKQPMNA
ncbi:phospholipase C [Sphingomonas trueperi]